MTARVLSSASRRAKLVYIVEWVLIVLSTIGIIAKIVLYSVTFDKIVDLIVNTNPEKHHRQDTILELKLYMILMGVIGTVVFVFGSLLNALLTHAVNSRIHVYCKIWFIFQSVLQTVAAIGLIIFLIVRTVRGDLSYSIIGYFLFFLYRNFTLIFIGTFMKELKEEQEHNREERVVAYYN